MSQAFIQTNLDIIATIRGLGPSGCKVNCGFDAEEIRKLYTLHFPANPLTQEEVTNLLASGARRGIYRIAGVDENGQDLYLVNGMMAAQNPANVVFMAPQNQNDIRPGFLPCDTCIKGAQLHPYGIGSSGLPAVSCTSNSGHSGTSVCPGISFR